MSVLLARILVVSLLMALCCPAFGNTVERQLLVDIKRSKQSLARLQQQQLKTREKLARQLSALEMSVEKLRDEVGDMQRREDEKTLALDTLKERLRTWQQQDAYQRHAIAQYLKAAGESTDDSDFGSLLSGVERALADLEQRLEPAWQSANVVGSSGELLAAQTLRLGPVTWMYDPATGQAGVLSLTGDIPSVLLPFDSDSSAALGRVYSSGSGQVFVDPTLSRVAKLSTQHDSALGHLQKGGIWTLPILLCAVVALLCALAKTWQLYRMPAVRPTAAARLRTVLQGGDTKAVAEELNSSTPAELQIVEICRNNPDISTREDALFAYLMQRREQLEKWLGAIAVIAAVAPLLG
ncbi:MAG: hypothetical protein CSA53_05045, partial [Gammaproteobacteria bacterium]